MARAKWNRTGEQAEGQRIRATWQAEYKACLERGMTERDAREAADEAAPDEERDIAIEA